jgi:ribosomal-protein-alanine N-acetyltransferase
VQIETPRLFLRPYTAEDGAHVQALLREPLVWQYSTRTPTDSLEDAQQHLGEILEHYAQGNPDFYALFRREDAIYLGEAGVLSINARCKRAVLGYNLLPAYWGQGYATEITRALVAHWFSVEQMVRLEALVLQGNGASQRVLEKSGFVLEGVLRKFSTVRNVSMDVYYYGMIDTDFQRVQEGDGVPL